VQRLLVAGLAALGTAETQAVLAETALYLGVGTGNLINLFNPERIVLGGWAGLLLGERLLPAIRSAAQAHALKQPFAEATISQGLLGPAAVALGAATLPMEAFLEGSAALSLTTPPSRP
jgi:predicted NBD/HSP70 family sugar kinase